MKKVIAVAVALLASSAFASSNLEFGDLNYLLKSGQFNLTSNFTVENSEVEDTTTSPSGKYETNGYVVDNRLSYGIADNLNVFVGLDFAFQYETELPGNPDSDNSGLSNPYFGAIYRAANQNDQGLNVDFGVRADVKIMDSEYGYNGKDGGFNKGNHALELNTRLGRKWNEANEWQFIAGAVYNADGEYTQNLAGGDNDVDTDSSLDFYMRALYQYRPVQEFMMVVSATARRVGEVEADDDAGNKYKDESHIDYNFGFSAKYLITENFIGRFNYGLNRLEEYDREVNGTDAEQKNRFMNTYGFGIDWLF